MNQLDAQKTKFMLALVDEFKDFMSVSIEEGHHENFPDDHFEFLKVCMETFIEMKYDAEASKD
jgi:hypothetical protein